jgi:hypothetical protein
MFATRYLIRTELLKSLHIDVDHETGEFTFDPDFKFRYSDFKGEWWYQFAIDNRDAVNESELGARMKGKAPTDKEIGMWIEAVGIVLKTQVTKGICFYSVDQQAMQFLLATLKRRRQAGTMPWVKLAEEQLAKQQRE